MKDSLRLKVNRKGTIIIPKSILSEIGADPGRLVEIGDMALVENRWDRRAFIKWSVSAGGVATATFALYADLLGVRSRFDDNHRSAVSADTELMRTLFGSCSSSRIACAPARNHPLQPLEPGQDLYDIEAQCLDAYLDRFTTAFKASPKRKDLKIHPMNDVVLFGSQVSNLQARALLGNPFANPPIQDICSAAGQRISLRWNLCIDSTSPVKIRQQYGIAWRYRDHRLYDFHTKRSVPQDHDHGHGSDLLLVTCLPRNAQTPQRTIIFGGLHGLGTSGTIDLLLRPRQSELSRLHDLVGGSPAYQAVYRVFKEDGGGRKVSLHAATTLG